MGVPAKVNVTAHAVSNLKVSVRVLQVAIRTSVYQRCAINFKICHRQRSLAIDMFEEVLFRLIHHWQVLSKTRAIQTLVPILLGLDMVFPKSPGTQACKVQTKDFDRQTRFAGTQSILCRY